MVTVLGRCSLWESMAAEALSSSVVPAKEFHSKSHTGQLGTSMAALFLTEHHLATLPQIFVSYLVSNNKPLLLKRIES